MARKNYQIRFNTPGGNSQGVTAVSLINGDAFTPYISKGSIEQLGIQAIPGTKFYLNNSPDPIMIGSTGIYELDVTNRASINAIRFDKKSISIISDSNGILSLLIDIIYREE